jgi:hypothetical protein
MIERTCIGRVKNLNFAAVGDCPWNMIPMPGINTGLHPNVTPLHQICLWGAMRRLLRYFQMPIEHRHCEP